MLHFSIITPDRTVYEDEVDAVSLPTPAGEITVLPHHIPLISIVSAGTITVRRGEETTLMAVSRGVIEVDGRSIRLLADTADRAEELEEAAIEKAKAEAQRLLTEKRADAEEYAVVQGQLERELARLHVVRRHRSKKRV